MRYSLNTKIDFRVLRTQMSHQNQRSIILFMQTGKRYQVQQGYVVFICPSSCKMSYVSVEYFVWFMRLTLFEALVL